MEAAIAQDTTCGVFRRLEPDALEPGAIHRFVVGEDTALRRLTTDEAAAELGDPFATEVLLKGTFPVTAEQVLAELERAVPGPPLFFLVGEGSQVPFSAGTARLARGLRFLVTTVAPPPDGPDVMLSTGRPDSGDVELMAWDRVHGGFNYYRTIGDNSAWVFAGNSRHAVSAGTEGKGPFETHTSGNLVMKELRFPWVHWHSFKARILPLVFAADDPLRRHRWFGELDPSGGATLEVEVVKPSIDRWTRVRLEQLRSGDDLVVERPARIVEQIVGTPTVNLITSGRESRAAVVADDIDLPQTFFADTEALVEVLGLDAPPPLMVTPAVYAQSLRTSKARLSDGRGFEQPGDTHFAFLVPERAFEDTALVRDVVAAGLVSDRLAGCLLMTDFPNPIFSARRRALLVHAPGRGTVSGGQSDFSDTMGKTIVAAAGAAGPDSPEAEFAALWNEGDGWRDAANASLAGYFAAVQQQIATQDGFDAYCRLAESRRQQVRDETPLVEFALLLPKTDIPPAVRTMRRDGTVEEA